MIDLLRELFSALGRNKLRTVLTGCSVTVGMFLLIVLLGASNGVIHAFMANAGGLRLDVVNVYNGTTSKVWQGMQANRSIQLDDRDHNLLPRRFEEQVMQANRVVEQSAKVRFRNETASMSVRGVTAEYLQTNPLKLLAGRFVNPLDERDRRKSIVVSSKVLEQLKLNQPASAVVGQVLEVDSLCFRIVGVFADRENERQLYGYIPFSTARLLQKKGSRYDFLELKTQASATTVPPSVLHAACAALRELSIVLLLTTREPCLFIMKPATRRVSTSRWTCCIRPRGLSVCSPCWAEW
mgnify:CR=1 FL=1